MQVYDGCGDSGDARGKKILPSGTFTGFCVRIHSKKGCPGPKGIWPRGGSRRLEVRLDLASSSDDGCDSESKDCHRGRLWHCLRVDGQVVVAAGIAVHVACVEVRVLIGEEEDEEIVISRSDEFADCVASGSQEVSRVSVIEAKLASGEAIGREVINRKRHQCLRIQMQRYIRLGRGGTLVGAGRVLREDVGGRKTAS